MRATGFWWVLFACLIFGVLHSGLASNKMKDFVRKSLGEQVAHGYRLIYVVIASLSTLFLALPVLTLPDAIIYKIPPPWVYLTLFLQLAGGVCLVVALLQTSNMHFLGLAQLRRPELFVAEGLNTGGFYSFTRHPIYFFSLVVIWLFPLMTWNLLALFIGVTIYTLIGSRFEEHRLLEEFGQQYAAYQRRTPWIIPKLKK